MWFLTWGWQIGYVLDIEIYIEIVTEMFPPMAWDNNYGSVGSSSALKTFVGAHIYGISPASW